MSVYIVKCSVGTSEHVLKEEIRNVLYKSGFHEKTLSLFIMDNKRDLDKFCFCWVVDHKKEFYKQAEKYIKDRIIKEIIK